MFHIDSCSLTQVRMSLFASFACNGSSIAGNGLQPDARCRGKAQQTQTVNKPITHVDLPPPQAETCRGGVGVMVVMPPLAKPQRAEEEVVAALVTRWKRLSAPQVTKGVHTPRHVMDQKNPRQPAPHQARCDTGPRAG